MYTVIHKFTYHPQICLRITFWCQWNNVILIVTSLIYKLKECILFVNGIYEWKYLYHRLLWVLTGNANPLRDSVSGAVFWFQIRRLLWTKPKIKENISITKCFNMIFNYQNTILLSTNSLKHTTNIKQYPCTRLLDLVKTEETILKPVLLKCNNTFMPVPYFL